MYTSSFKVNFAKESTLINWLGCRSSSGLIPHSLLISIYISFISIFDFNILSIICQMIKYKINILYCIYFFLEGFFPLISPFPLLKSVWIVLPTWIFSFSHLTHRRNTGIITPLSLFYDIINLSLITNQILR